MIIIYGLLDKLKYVDIAKVCANWELLIIRFKYNLGQKYYAPQVRPDRGLNSWPPDHDSTFYVTETLLDYLRFCKSQVNLWARSGIDEMIGRSKFTIIMYKHLQRKL